jgi:hypothetical protein
VHYSLTIALAFVVGYLLPAAARAQPGPLYSGSGGCYTIIGPQGAYTVCPSDQAPVTYGPYRDRPDRIEVLGGRRFGPFGRASVWAGSVPCPSGNCPTCPRGAPVGVSYGPYSLTGTCPGGCPNCPTTRVYPGTFQR